MAAHQATIVTDLLFGDSGKGTIVDWAVRAQTVTGRPTLVVRHSGGAQAAHAVVTPDGREHTFQQWGSGTFVPGVQTLLSQYMLVNPLTLFWENERLKRVGIDDGLARLLLHADALVTSPYQMAANRLKERRRGVNRHGSCGLGIGETASDALSAPTEAIRVRTLGNPKALRPALLQHRAKKRAECAPSPDEPEFALFADDDELDSWLQLCSGLVGSATVVEDTFLPKHLANPRAATVFEGSQGVLLDEWRGFHPYTTWSTVTTANALTLLSGSGADVTSLGVLRGYATRHGAGPFPTEDPALTQQLPDDTNPDNPWQGTLRVGWPDLPLLRYGLMAAGRIDALAITCLDRMTDAWQVATEYENAVLSLGPWQDLEHQANLTERLKSARPRYQPWAGSPEAHAEFLARALAKPLAVTSWGKRATDKRWSG